MIDPRRAAFLIIDMQHGFINPDSALCIAGAKATLPACAQALDKARLLAMPVFYIRREYAEDGSNVEAARFPSWVKGGRPISSACPESLDVPKLIAPLPVDRIITKPRYSAFHHTALDAELRALDISTLVVTGTTTPNCIRTTCYDGLSLNYNVALIEDCTSSRTPEAQAANIEDMALAGVQVIDLATFLSIGIATLRDFEAEQCEAVRNAT